MDEKLRIQELQAVTARALDSVAYDGPPSARIRAVPDARTIRYYTTIALIDRPAEMQGRTAFYGRRHVLQLVCIKRLQAGGLSLAEVQEKLAGATTRRLMQFAGLPESFWEQPLLRLAKPATVSADSVPVLSAPAAADVGEAAESFWTRPAMPARNLSVVEPVGARPIACVRLPVAQGVALEFAGVDLQRLTPESVAALQPLLAELSRELRRWGLVAEEQSDERYSQRGRE